MRICIASPALDVYSETFIRTHIERLPFDVRVLSGPGFGDVDGESLLRRSKIRRVPEFIARGLGRYDPQDFAVARIARWLKSNKIQVVLAEYGRSGVRLLPACKRAGVPMIVHFHGYDAHKHEVTERLAQSYQEMFRDASAIVGVSKHMVEHLVCGLGAPREKVHWIPYFVDTDCFRVGHVTGRQPLLLSVGRFVEKKAPQLTLLAFNGASGKIPEARLEMVGDGPLLGACRWLVKSLGIQDRVTFHGAMEHSGVVARMEEARAFVQHSVKAVSGDSEGTPVAILEAQSAGLPVISTRHAGILDVVVEGVSGYLSNEGDVDTMAEHMVRVLGMDGDEWQHMSDAARRRIVNNFGPAHTINKLADLIRSTCAECS